MKAKPLAKSKVEQQQVNHAMNEDRKHEEGFRFGTMILWLVGFFILYLLSTGPVTRWFPKVADVIYVPIQWIAHNETFAKVMIAWLHLWGVPLDQ